MRGNPETVSLTTNEEYNLVESVSKMITDKKVLIRH